MSAAKRMAELARRRALLALLFFAPGKTQSVRRLRDELDSVHSLVATTDQVRADLQWLEELSMADVTGDMATVTERGCDVVCNRAQLPGES